MKINLAQAYKWKSMPEKCKEIVDNEDWSSRGNHIKLAVALLKDDFGEAVILMRKLGIGGEVKEHDYKDWPLFRELRNRPEFFEAFASIYGKPYKPVEKIIARMNKAWRELKIEHVFESDVNLGIEPDPDYSI